MNSQSEKMLNIASHQGNANQKYEISPHNYQNGHHPHYKKKKERKETRKRKKEKTPSNNYELFTFKKRNTTNYG